jgi:Predicted membrane protein (DUF2157)
LSPEVAEAIGGLREKGILSSDQSAAFLRVARRELVSVRFELRALLYGGVLLAIAGLGLFLKENQDRIGPVVIASLLAAAAAGCILFVRQRSPAFSWGTGGESHVAADYILLLGVLLIGSDLAYIESRFRFLGADWPYHLLVVSVIAFAAAYRFDSRVALSLALSSFAAWRGLSTRFPLESHLGRQGEVRANALACAILFLAAAFVSVRAKKKAHFEGVFAAFGWLLLFGGLLSGTFQSGPGWPLWEIATCGAAAAVIAFAYRFRRLFDFTVGVIAGYLGLLRLWKEISATGEVFFLGVALSSLGVVVLLALTYRTMRRHG